MQSMLVMFKADGVRRDFPLTRDHTIIGRTSSCDLRVPLSSVSRQHCEIRIENGDLKVRDLGSSNGTFVNASRITEATLEAGDELVIGPIVFTVVINGQPAEIEAVRSLVQVGTNQHDPVSQDEATSSRDESPAAGSAQPKEMAIHDAADEALPEVEPEQYTPTVDLDDDPIAALQKMADEDHDDDDQPLPLPTDDDIELEDESQP